MVIDRLWFVVIVSVHKKRRFRLKINLKSLYEPNMRQYPLAYYVDDKNSGWNGFWVQNIAKMDFGR